VWKQVYKKNAKTILNYVNYMIQKGGEFLPWLNARAKRQGIKGGGSKMTKKLNNA
jgi:hypothetical protein